ncbi:DNA repair protein RecO [Lacticaseibacillus saniviri]|uniref:DNA repair protein RecO n=1 Tax=Lacticaseibacillus saniviri JCM 17471 = DSM 24301 TaxID=1293598 RepID=A0A0R2MXQ3_9LACO|nr:DNA repair protein RecO [Lacticaseibacillus saniviri]KRO18185.1 DNA repair protein recO [Lacticaseibacillus saniviri JCM 17471 = DSM 24301]
MAKQIVEFTGLVLTRQNYRESDLLVKILTDRFGKKMFLVSRARKPGFRMNAGILPFTLATYVGDVRDPGLSFINTVKEAKQFQTISQDIELNAYATYILSLIDLAYPDGEAIPTWFALAQQALALIDEGYDAQVLTNIIEVQLLQAFGVQPEWRGCVICHRTDLPFDFSEAYGGLLCQNHFDRDPYRYHLDQRVVYWLRLFSVVKLDQINDITLQPATKRQLQVALDRIYQDMVGVVPKAKRFLNQMNRWHLPDDKPKA